MPVQLEHNLPPRCRSKGTVGSRWASTQPCFGNITCLHPPGVAQMRDLLTPSLHLDSPWLFSVGSVALVRYFTALPPPQVINSLGEARRPEGTNDSWCWRLGTSTCRRLGPFLWISSTLVPWTEDPLAAGGCWEGGPVPPYLPTLFHPQGHQAASPATPAQCKA